MRLSRSAETAIGLAVAAALAAAVLAVRHRQAPRGGSPEATTGGAPAADLPDLTREDAALDLGDVRVAASAGPRPLFAFARNRFRFRAESGGAPVALESAVVSFTMAMPMGDHRHALVAAADGWQETEAVLPSCPSGRRRWFGTLDFALAGRARSARFAFDLAPPPPGDGAAAPRP
jgi:hypothetical protein